MRLRDTIDQHELTPENVDLFLSAVVVLREHDLLDNEYGRTLAGRGAGVEMLYNERDEDCMALVDHLEAKGVAVERPTYDSGWAKLRRGDGYAPLVEQSIIDAYLEAMARAERGRPWAKLAVAFGGAAAAAAGALAIALSPAAREALGGLVVPAVGGLVVAAVLLAGWGASVLREG